MLRGLKKCIGKRDGESKVDKMVPRVLDIWSPNTAKFISYKFRPYSGYRNIRGQKMYYGG